MGVVAKFGNLIGRFCRSPIRTIASLPDLFESVRMRFAGDSTFRRKQDLVHASNCPDELLHHVLQIWKPRSALDVGCGTGRVIDYFVSQGVNDVLGLEGSVVAIRASNHPDLIRQADLSVPQDLGRKFDLVYTVEVAEHIRPEAADIFVDTCVRHADRVLFTAAHPGQGGLGHLNEQPPAYWVEKFASRGFQYDEDLTEKLRPLLKDFPENLLIFVRR